MELSYERVDLAACQAAKHAPELIVRRSAGEVWLVSEQPIELGKPITWMASRSGDYLRIPLVPYRLKSEPDLALGYMFGLGIRVTLDFAGRSVRQLRLAIGCPLNDMSQADQLGGLQYWCGFALLLQG